MRTIKEVPEGILHSAGIDYSNSMVGFGTGFSDSFPEEKDSWTLEALLKIRDSQISNVWTLEGLKEFPESMEEIQKLFKEQNLPPTNYNLNIFLRGVRENLTKILYFEYIQNYELYIREE